MTCQHGHTVKTSGCVSCGLLHGHATGADLHALIEQMGKLRTAFDALLIREVQVFGGIPVHGGRTGAEQTALREAIAELLELEAALAASPTTDLGEIGQRVRALEAVSHEPTVIPIGNITARLEALEGKKTSMMPCRFCDTPTVDGICRNCRDDVSGLQKAKERAEAAESSFVLLMTALETLEQKQRQRGNGMKGAPDWKATEGATLLECAKQLSALLKEAKLAASPTTDLRPWAKHTPLCAVRGGYDYPCNCGLDAALASQGAQKERSLGLQHQFKADTTGKFCADCGGCECSPFHVASQGAALSRRSPPS